jgi:hypothetical protein
VAPAAEAPEREFSELLHGRLIASLEKILKPLSGTNN